MQCSLGREETEGCHLKVDEDQPRLKNVKRWNYLLTGIITLGYGYMAQDYAKKKR